MRNGVLTILFLIAGTLRLSAQEPQPAVPDQLYRSLQQLSAANLNFGTSSSADSLTSICRQIESLARQSGDIGLEFKTGQIMVNTYALTGNQALAVNKAQELMTRASQLNNPTVKGLALQAMADTYLFSDRYQLADSMMHEAAPLINQYGNTYMQAELLLQKLHIHLYLLRAKNAKQDIAQLHKLLASADTGAGEPTHRFLLESYETLDAIHSHDVERAKQLLSHVASEKPTNGNFDLWHYYLQSQYYSLVENYKIALAYSDSTFMQANQGQNSNILRTALKEKAQLLNRIGHQKEACLLYNQISNLSDSLNKLQYIAQIDSLHVTFWIDQLQIDNINQRNELYTKIICGLLILTAIIVAIIIFVRHRNHKLELSRLRLKAMREASEDSLRNKSLFLSNMSHELRTPLNAITGFSTILTDEEGIDDQMRRQCSDYIHQNADLLMKLISDVVDLSELKDDSIRFTYAPCNVVALCRAVTKTVENVKHTQAEIRFETDLEQLELDTDNTRLQQVLINLLINATKFTPQGIITLRLQLDPTQQEVVFTIEDTGCGIPVEKQSRIFERYEKLHENIQGAGLGLSICHLIVTHTGGRIWVDSQYTAGARFVFTHPLHPQNNPA